MMFYSVFVSHLLKSGEIEDGGLEFPYILEFVFDKDFISLYNVDDDVIELPRSVYVLRSVKLMEGDN